MPRSLSGKRLGASAGVFPAASAIRLSQKPRGFPPSPHAKATRKSTDAHHRPFARQLVRASLSEAVKKELQAMDPATYEYQSDFAKHYVAKGIEQGLEQGEAKGREEGMAEGIVRGETRLLLKLLTHRFGPLPAEAVARIESNDAATIEALADRFVTAESLSDLFE